MTRNLDQEGLDGCFLLYEAPAPVLPAPVHSPVLPPPAPLPSVEVPPTTRRFSAVWPILFGSVAIVVGLLGWMIHDQTIDTAPVVSAPVVSTPVVSAPVVSAPVVSAPVVSQTWTLSFAKSDTNPLEDFAPPDWLKQCQAIEINGYTCNLGSDTTNQRLSLERATTVKNLLSSAGFPVSMTVHGLGASHPIASNTTAQGRASNRRVEVTCSH